MTDDGTHRCPCCDVEGDWTTVYRHLQTSHRKSDICRRLLADQPTESEWVGEKYVESGTAD